MMALASLVLNSAPTQAVQPNSMVSSAAWAGAGAAKDMSPPSSMAAAESPTTPSDLRVFPNMIVTSFVYRPWMNETAARGRASLQLLAQMAGQLPCQCLDGARIRAWPEHSLLCLAAVLAGCDAVELCRKGCIDWSHACRPGRACRKKRAGALVNLLLCMQFMQAAQPLTNAFQTTCWCRTFCLGYCRSNSLDGRKEVELDTTCCFVHRLAHRTCIPIGTVAVSRRLAALSICPLGQQIKPRSAGL